MGRLMSRIETWTPSYPLISLYFPEMLEYQSLVVSVAKISHAPKLCRRRDRLHKKSVNESYRETPNLHRQSIKYKKQDSRNYARDNERSATLDSILRRRERDCVDGPEPTNLIGRVVFQIQKSNSLGMQMASTTNLLCRQMKIQLAELAHSTNHVRPKTISHQCVFISATGNYQ